MKSKLLNFVTAIAVVILLAFPKANYAQAPNLGSAAKFVLFSTNGAVTNTGFSHLTGNVGTNNGALTGFGNVDGAMHNNDGTTALCATDLLSAYNQLKAATPTFFPAPLLGNGQALNAGVYSISADATLNGTLTLNGQGNANAVFIFQIQGTLSSGAAAQVSLTNGTKACNVFWKIEGAVSLASGTKMKGTVIANNAAISMTASVNLEGRALSTTGAVGINGITAYMPLGCGTPTLTGPAAPSLASTACYALFSANGSVTNTGISTVTGDIGTNVGQTSGYNSATVTGTIHSVPDASTATCASDLTNVNTYLNALATDIELLYPAQFGASLVLTPHTYLMNTAAVLTDTVFLNAQGNANAVFVIKINGALSTSTAAKVILINGAQAKNVFWKVNGAVSINTNTGFSGTIVSNSTMNLSAGTILAGRALTTTGALTTAAIAATMPPGCGTSCVYSISPSSQTYTASGGAGSITLSTGSTCAWTASASCSFVTVSNTSGTGNATVTYAVQANTGSASRTCTITVGGKTYTVTQDGTSPCTYSISPASQSFTTTGGTGNIALTTGSTCTWTASASCSFVTVSNTSGTGNATISYTVQANTGSASRTCVITVGGQTYTVTQDGTSPCTYSISPASQTFTTSGGTGNISLTTSSTCVWTASASCSFVTVNNTSGTGNATISYTVQANTGSASRTCAITVGGQTFAVTQDGTTPCTYSISPASQTYTTSGGTGNISLTTGSTCVWTASASCSFVTVSNTSGTGNATISYTVQANTGSASRTCTITVGGQTFAVTQDGTSPCTYSISPISQALSASGGAGNITLTTGNGCAWSATASCGFVLINNASGTGNATINYTVQANTGSNSRTCTITVGGQTFTIIQDGTSPCTYSISPKSQTFTASAGAGNITLTTGSTCAWVASASCGFVTVNNTSGTGNATINYTVQANTGSNSRTCTITVAGQTFSIVQDGTSPCTYSISPISQTLSASGGAGNITLTTGSSCAWLASASCGFVTVNNTSGTGNATINYTVQTNTGSNSRTCTITVGGQTFSIVQDGTSPCTYSISPISQTLSASGGAGNFTLTTGSTCAWVASASCSFVTVNNTSGTGNSTITYSVQANTGSNSRTCTITVGGQTFTIVQDGTSPCTYSISPVSQTLTAGGGAGSITLTTGSTCAWSATASCNFVIINNTSGTGNATITYTVQANTGVASRTCTITVGGQTFAITQDGTIGIDKLNNPLALTISPNPTHGLFMLTYEANGTEDMQVQVINLLGEVVYSIKAQKVSGKFMQEINLEQVNAGVYFVRVQTPYTNYTQRLIVQ